MKRNRVIILALTVLAAFAFAVPAQAGKNRSGGKKAQQQVQSLNATDAVYLTFMREEEKLARDVYFVMSDKWNVQIFSNISVSEQRHMDAVLNLLNKYGLPDPILDEGEFVNEELQSLYDQLVVAGSVSLLDALKVGALIEEVDIEDLRDAIAETTNSDLVRVYTNLLNASYSHLRAFSGQIVVITGESYQAQHLSQSVVDSIL